MLEADTQNAASMIGRTISGRYTIRATIGSGGMGFVYRATQSPIEREVALKVLRVDLAHQDGIAERFTREARAASRIQHPNAITIFEFGEDDGIFYLAMELLSGETLRQRMRREPLLQAEHALDIFEAMAGALAAAHRVGVVHRDLKPDNIFLAQFEGLGEVVKVLDFGLAKLLDRGADAEGLVTDVNLRLGTPRYMAPEQALGLQPIDARCDVYALGLLLFEMLANRPPYSGEDGMEVLAQRLRREAPLLSHMVPEKNFSQAMDELLASMLKRDREHRPADANEVVTRLRELRKRGQVYLEASITDPDPVIQIAESPGAPTMQSPAVMPAPAVWSPRTSGSGNAYDRPVLPQSQSDLDDFDKPTVVIAPSADKAQSKGPGPGAVAGPIGPAALDRSLARPPSAVYSFPGGQYSGSFTAPPTTVQPSEPPGRLQLSRRIIVIVLVVAVGAPLLALLFRFLQGSPPRSEPMSGPALSAPAKRPPEAPSRAKALPQEADGKAAATGPESAADKAARDPGTKPASSNRPKMCKIRINSTPPGGSVERDGQAIGTTPITDTMPYGNTVMHYRITLAGYQPYETSVTAEHRLTMNAALKPAAAAPPPRPGPTPTPVPPRPK